MKKKKTAKAVLTVLLVLVLLWAAFFATDYILVCKSFEKPVFAAATITRDDGGSGVYVGFGYAADIEGNFMPEDELPGVTRAAFYLFGHKINEVVRD